MKTIKISGLFNILKFGWKLRKYNPRHFTITADGDIKQKVQYNMKDSADEAAMRMRKKTGRKISAYLCEVCGRYHVGNQGEETNIAVKQEG
jgi:hypothetical protein